MPMGLLRNKQMKVLIKIYAPEVILHTSEWNIGNEIYSKDDFNINPSRYWLYDWLERPSCKYYNFIFAVTVEFVQVIDRLF